MNDIAMLAVLGVVSIALIVYALFPKGTQEQEHVRRRMTGRRESQELEVVKDRSQHSAARQVLDKLAPYAIKPVMPGSAEEMTTLKHKLAQAGFRRDTATKYFLASKTIIGVGAALVGLLVLLGMGFPTKQVLGMAAFAGGVGFMLPNFWLSIAMRNRTEKIRDGLPDSLDLLVVSVESGLGLDAALQKVSDEMSNVHSELSEEMQIATLETQMGVPRAESLENMARRCGVDEMQALVAVIIQAERFGTSVARALRVQADTLRTKRRLKAEERAQKTTVKLMVPLILFIFPSIFVVLVGPAAMKLIAAFSGGGSLS